MNSLYFKTLTSSYKLLSSLPRQCLFSFKKQTKTSSSSIIYPCRYKTSFVHDYKQDDVYLYSKYLLDLNRNISTHNRSTKLRAEDCPPLLYDELGGKPVAAFQRLQDVVSIAEEIEENVNQLKELSLLANESNDEISLLSEIQLEADELNNEITDLKKSFKETLVRDKELEHCDGAILEVRAGVGGEEAMLFAMELYDMYYNFCLRYGMEIQEVDSDTEDSGGLLKASCIITSPDGYAYEILRHEAGIHRVQRVPKTETRGRIHTSTVSVAVIPKLDVSSFKLNLDDVEKHFSFSPGGGGQHVNKTLSCVTVRHVPTGIQVKCHATRIQVENLNRAMEQLKQILFKRYMDEKISKTNAVRLQQTRSRERSDKIRTYNFPNNRVTDHRIGYTVNGSLDSILSAGPAFFAMSRALNERFTEDDKVAVFKALLKEANIK